tara:strand:+ start:42080 stop:42391 length:312 start_codon:yes stop_codon:yes gene_type:complete
MAEQHPFGEQAEIHDHLQLPNNDAERYIKNFDNGYSTSVIKNSVSYGGKQGLYEMGVMYEGILTEVPGITVENDTVIGWLEFEEVIELMNKIENLESKNAYIN